MAGRRETVVADAVHGGTPYWGVCLGVQLLAEPGAAFTPEGSPRSGCCQSS